MFKRISLFLSLSAAFFALSFASALAQEGHDASISTSNEAADYAALPDAPQPNDGIDSPANSPVKPTVPGVARTKPAPRFAQSIEPDETTKVLTVKEKFQYSFVEQVSPYAVGSYLLSAGWEQLLGFRSEVRQQQLGCLRPAPRHQCGSPDQPGRIH